MEKLPGFTGDTPRADARGFHEMINNSLCSTADFIIPEQPFILAQLSVPESDIAIAIQTERVQSANKPVFGDRPVEKYFYRSNKARYLRNRHCRPGIFFTKNLKSKIIFLKKFEKFSMNKI